VTENKSGFIRYDKEQNRNHAVPISKTSTTQHFPACDVIFVERVSAFSCLLNGGSIWTVAKRKCEQNSLQLHC